MTGVSGMPVGTVSNPGGVRQWLRFGFPLARGNCPDTARLQLTTGSGEVIDAGFRVLTRWPDGSAQWVLADMVTGLSGPVYARVGAPEASGGGHQTSAEGDGRAGPDDQGQIQLGNGVRVRLSISLKGGARPLSLIRSHRRCEALCHESEYVFAVDGFPDLELSLGCQDVPSAGQCEMVARVHNRAASEHPNGCWDLGDPNSVVIDNLSLTVMDERGAGARLELADDSPEAGQGPLNFASGRLFQYGSGGEHWDSPVHVDKNGRSPVKERGFRLFDLQGQELNSGLRAAPRVCFGAGQAARALVPRHFWENFPSELALDKGEAIWHLFPEETELQPGEAKTWVCDLGFPQSRAWLAYNPAYIDQTGALLGCRLSADNQLSRLVDANLSGQGSFMGKREACDEYGWRHFGELYADHEALNAPDGDIFVSHYNNQYDPVWGFSLRFLSSGQEDWQTLAADLARHVVDIDLYKTDGDKVEYNNGLFWHTDHYLPALTATHRTYSRNHTYAYEGHQGGGGPGGQHCYASGLALRYLLTGDDSFRDAVEGLRDWIGYFYNGAPTLLARLHRLVTVDLRAGRMTNVGFIERGYRYPLDRGTGNYLNTLIDAYLIRQDERLLEQMHGVIVETVSPFDDPSARHLDDVEEHWFYIVFLQSLARYLLLKEQLDQPDDHYAYARLTLIRYTDWVVENEAPYLSNPGALEFPTDTWAAQDIRKANVLYYGAYFNPPQKDRLQRRADEFWDYCVTTLSSSPERHTTRIQAIVAQNLGVREWCLERQGSPYPMPEPEALELRRNRAGKRFVRDILAALRNFSLGHEIEWLKGRLGGR